MSWFKKIFTENNSVISKEVNSPLVLNTTPDYPISFGYKAHWFSIKANSAESIIEYLELDNPKTANWESGLKAINNTDYLFISPPINGWVMIIGTAGAPFDLTIEDNYSTDTPTSFLSILNKLRKKFSEVQYFGSYRVMDYVAWVKATHSQIIRAFAYSDGMVYVNEGEHNNSEKQLNIPNLSNLSPDEATNRIWQIIDEGCMDFPDEELPALLAENWSINPLRLDEYKKASTGFVVERPQLWQ